MSLSLQVLDFHDDIAKAQIADVGSKAPDFIKTATIASHDDISKLPNEAFALRIFTKEGSALRRYPLHTQADTWLSLQYFEKNAFKLPQEASEIAAHNIKTACIQHGILIPEFLKKMAGPQSMFTNIFKEMKTMKKIAHAEVEAKPEGGKYALNGKYPLFSEDFVKKASVYFMDYSKDFTAQERHEYAKNTLSRALELNVELPEDQKNAIEKSASEAYGDKLNAQINLRKKLVDGNESHSSSLDKVASAKDKVTPQQFVELLSQWDSETGMSRGYGQYIDDAYESTFGNFFSKEAGYVWEDAQAGITLTGKELEKAASSKYEKIKGYFGETLANSLKKHGSQIFESLPSDAKTVIAKIAKGSM
jgi:hypothetical protein